MHRCQSCVAFQRSKNFELLPVWLFSQRIHQLQVPRRQPKRVQRAQIAQMLLYNFDRLEKPTNRQSWVHSSHTVGRWTLEGRAGRQRSNSSAKDLQASSSTPRNACRPSWHLCRWPAGMGRPPRRNGRRRAAPRSSSTAAASIQARGTCSREDNARSSQ